MDAVGVESVEIFNGTTDLGDATINAAQGTWTFATTLAPGFYNDLYAVAKDASGNTATAIAPYKLMAGVSGQPYSAYEQLYDDGVYSGTDYFFTNVTGQPYSSYEYDYSAGNALIGSKFDYTGITGQPYTGEVVDYNGAGLLTSATFTGLTDPAYSAYQYDYVGGVFSGSQFTFTTVPAGATYSSYETDYNQAGNSLATASSSPISRASPTPAKKRISTPAARSRASCSPGSPIRPIRRSSSIIRPEPMRATKPITRHHGPVLYERGGRRLRRQSTGEGRLLRHDVDALFVGRAGLFRRRRSPTSFTISPTSRARATIPIRSRTTPAALRFRRRSTSTAAATI